MLFRRRPLRWGMRRRGTEADVVVIGAGASGLSAARVVAERGARVVVVEARRRVGGRVWTERARGFPLPVELGAEFVHGRPEATWRLIRESGVRAYDISGEHWQWRAGRLRPADAGEQMHEAIARIGKIRGRDVSFAEALERVKGSVPRAAVRMARGFVEGFDAADVERVSAKSIVEEQEGLGDLEHQRQCRLVEGYGGLVEWIERRVKEAGGEIRLGWPVSTVRWERGRVEVRGARGVVRGRAAVVTLPVGVLHKGDGEGAVKFSPEVAEKRAAAAKLGSGPVVKIVIAFDQAFWEDPKVVRRAGKGFGDFGFAHAADAAFPTWWSALPLRVPVLTGWAGGPKAAELSGRSVRAVTDVAVGVVSELMGVSRRKLERMLVSARTHDWPADPWSRGAYSYVLVGGQGACEELARPVEATLFFAGEAADVGDQASTVAGAIGSGERAGRAVKW